MKLQYLNAVFCCIFSSTVVRGQQQALLTNLPCVKQFNQLYCDQGGFSYPGDKISTFIDDNKSLMRRMYGTLVQIEEPEVVRRTPASTTFARSVRQFGGSRFKRSVEEGFLEDFLLDDELYNDLDANFTALLKDSEDWPKDGKISLHFGKKKQKRQVELPGNPDKTDSNRMDSCESRTEVTTPYWATNSNGQVRAIVNSKSFEQAVHQEICTTTRTLRCAGDCACEQKYKWHRLLAYDPNNDCAGIFMDWFLFPSCCACRCLKNPLLQ